MPSPPTRIIAIASGKGGAGKSSTAAGLAWILAEKGSKVCLVDADLGLSNVDVLLGLTPKYTLEDLLLQDLAPEEVLTSVRPGLDIISGGSGIAALADLDRAQRRRFIKKIASLTGYDFLILDNSPGIHRQVVSFCLAAREQIIVINPEPSSVTDGYALLKVLKQNGLHRPPYILLNRVPEHFNHDLLMERFAAVCKKYLQLNILSLGAVPDDPVFRRAAARQMLPVALSPASPGSRALIRAAALISGRSNLKVLHTEVEDFWSASLVSLLQGTTIDPEHARQKPKTVPASAVQKSPWEAMAALEQGVSRLEHMGRAALKTVNGATDRLHMAAERLVHVARDLELSSHSTNSVLNVGVLCPDLFLRQLLEDVLRDRGYRPIVVNGSWETMAGLDMLICSVTKPDELALDTLHALAGVPCIWLSQYTRHVPSWAKGLAVVDVLGKPFSLEKIYTALSRAAGSPAALSPSGSTDTNAPAMA